MNPETARVWLSHWAANAGIPHADRLHIRRDTDRGRTWAVVVLSDKGGHYEFSPEFSTWPKCEAYVRGLIDGWRAAEMIGRVVERGHVTDAPHPYAS